MIVWRWQVKIEIASKMHNLAQFCQLSDATEYCNGLEDYWQIIDNETEMLLLEAYPKELVEA